MSKHIEEQIKADINKELLGCRLPITPERVKAVATGIIQKYMPLPPKLEISVHSSPESRSLSVSISDGEGRSILQPQPNDLHYHQVIKPQEREGSIEETFRRC